MLWFGGWGLHWVWMLVFWVVVIGLIAWGVARLAPSSRGDSEDRARSILDQRYARGEIDDDEYRRRRDELDG
jgi:putative membrane protein